MKWAIVMDLATVHTKGNNEKLTDNYQMYTRSIKCIYLPVFFVVIAAWLDQASGQLPDVYQQGVLQPYTGYSDVTLFKFHVPPAAARGRWQFAAVHDDPSCQARQVHVFLQYGSYPVINHGNGSALYDRGDSLRRLTVVSTPQPHPATELTVEAPQPGQWYAAAYIADADRAVSQQGLSHHCQYSLGSIGYWRQETPQLLPVNQPVTVLTIARQSFFRFFVPSGVESVSVSVSGCRPADSGAPPPDAVHPCLAWVGLRPSALPNGQAATDGDPLSWDGGPPQWSISGLRSGATHTLRPELLWHDVYYYLALVADNSAELTVTVTLRQCEFLTTDGRPPAADVTTTQLANRSHNAGPPPERCAPLTRLTRVQYAQDFTDTFLAVNAAFYHTWLALTERRISSVTFETHELEDIGGTLYVDLRLSKLIMGDSRQVVTVSGCVSPHVLPVTDTGELLCHPGLAFNLSSASERQLSAVRLVPFPEPARWFVSLRTSCYNASSGSQLPCVRSQYAVNLDIHLQPCVWPGAPCGEHGICRENHRGRLYFTACSCLDGYRGWDCSDGSAAVPSGRRLLSVSLLTLSNLALLPAVVLSVRRRLATLALVYAAAMVASMLYHLCDQLGRQLTGTGYCLLRFEVLQFCDFFGCVLSCWVTLVSLAEWRRAEPTLHVLGAVLAAAAVRWRPTALGVFLVPVLLAAAVPVAVYAARSWRRGRLLKLSRSWLLRHLLPGLTLALIAVGIFTGLETVDNYQYTHSAWHLALSLSLLALLPDGGRRGPSPSDQLQLIPEDADSDRVSFRHELDELGAGRVSPTFCRSDSAAPARAVVATTGTAGS
ncbi:Post-GPI attachment to proteins factor 6 [Amphibalanus amphitrite]|uniref:Post-GPI attachment to proteins factor 6 n=1 Tax=Amphibalanus amphitrite TaxID=1232801 RepID=A0A6A4X2V9_AMPAM|nr:Post-GPI attachment to proteins factor 6 [Amphibalanus amphitrite]